MKFQVPLSQAEEERFHHEKLHEVILARNQSGVFELSFWFAGLQDKTNRAQAFAAVKAQPGLIPEYIKVQAHL
jgi:hypothetical protein